MGKTSFSHLSLSWKVNIFFSCYLKRNQKRHLQLQNEWCLLHVTCYIKENKVSAITYINFSLKINFVTKCFLVLLICCGRTEFMSSCSPFIFRELALFPNCKNMNIISKLHLKFLPVTIWPTNSWNQSLHYQKKSIIKLSHRKMK